MFQGVSQLVANLPLKVVQENNSSKNGQNIENGPTFVLKSGKCNDINNILINDSEKHYVHAENNVSPSQGRYPPPRV